MENMTLQHISNILLLNAHCPVFSSLIKYHYCFTMLIFHSVDDIDIKHEYCGKLYSFLFYLIYSSAWKIGCIHNSSVKNHWQEMA